MIPSAPLPKHITKDDPILVKALTKVISNDRHREGKENVESRNYQDYAGRNTQRDSGMSFGNPTKSSGFDDLDADGFYPPIHAQARAHQAYQRAQLGHGRAAPSETVGKKPNSRYPSNSTNDERIKALEEAHLRRAPPEPPKEPVFTLKRVQTETFNSAESGDSEGRFYQLDPTPVVSPIRVEGAGFQTITAATPRPAVHETERKSEVQRDTTRAIRSPETSESETTIDLSLTVSRACESEDEVLDVGNETFAQEDVSRFDTSYAESHGAHGVQVAFQETIKVIHNERSPTEHEQETEAQTFARAQAKHKEIESRNLDDVNDSSFDNSGDISASRDGNETGWTSTSGDDSGVTEDAREKRPNKDKKQTGEQMNDVLSVSAGLSYTAGTSAYPRLSAFRPHAG